MTMGTYLFTVGTYCYVAVKRGRLGGERRFGAHRGRKKGAGAYCGGSRTACYYYYYILCVCATYVCQWYVVRAVIQVTVDHPARRVLSVPISHTTVASVVAVVVAASRLTQSQRQASDCVASQVVACQSQPRHAASSFFYLRVLID